MKQLTLAAVGFDRYAKTTRRAGFLAEMERVVLWPALCALIEPFYPKPGNGRPPVGVERMLRIYFLQQWFNLSDPAVEEALSIRWQCGVLWTLISAASRCLTRRQSVAFVTCSKLTSWGRSCSTRCSDTWQRRD